MAAFQSVFLIAVLGCIALPLRGQSDDWRSVEGLAPGASISVVTRGRRACELIQVAESNLTCDRQRGMFDRRLVIPRAQIREIRLEETGHTHMIAGILIGAAAGALVGFVAAGQSSDPETRGYGRAFGIPLGAVIGGAVGHNIHGHGAVIYRRP